MNHTKLAISKEITNKKNLKPNTINSINSQRGKLSVDTSFPL